MELQVFQLWYLAVKVEKVSGDALENILEKTDQIFPNIRNLSREEQLILGQKVLDDAPIDADLLNDPRTETSL